jgi:hypothetical protein
MGDAADDTYDAEEVATELSERMRLMGCKRCPLTFEHDENECPICLDLGWIDAEGNPCEP